MNDFNTDHFVRRLVGETLFFDEEYGVGGNLSLVDERNGKEMFVSAYLPDSGEFVIEEATEWEDYEPGSDDDIGYALAVDSKEYGAYQTPEEIAQALMLLARDHNLMPSITLRFEEDEEE